MDNVEDSGFDSDPKTATQNDPLQDMAETHSSVNGATEHIKLVKKTDLQKKLERQREASRRLKDNHDKTIDQQPKKSYLLPHSRLLVPGRHSSDTSKRQDEQPLVAIVSDSEEDEFETPKLSKEAHREITQQLIKDGYNLDLEPDDEDLDLIPPRPLSERCVCCNHTLNNTCSIQ
ncbi:protein FAM219A-like isoform X2 [Liolophura sinensis]|uniref:protein FAM219A-like isoform X2 n=1 Tax=Liolophura sinensis TaxID=3198878 RepID=UPI00315949B9